MNYHQVTKKKNRLSTKEYCTCEVGNCYMTCRHKIEKDFVKLFINDKNTHIGFYVSVKYCPFCGFHYEGEA